MINFIKHQTFKPVYIRALSSKSFQGNVGNQLYGGVVPKIGLEVHAQLKLESKLFSSGSARLGSPNTHLDLLDIALPGSLPKLNRDALRTALLTCIGLNCTIPDAIHFDRKNYFYTDMPAGYQITQHNRPIGIDGFVEFIATTYQKSVISHSQPYDLVRYLYFNSRKEMGQFSPYVRKSRIKQIQLEQDSAKTLHQMQEDSDSEVFSLIDYNRSGVGLMEIVFEPDLTNHHEASSLIKELTIILRSLDTCDCKMQLGSLRVDANVSLEHIPGVNIEQSERVELKNLNSIGFVNRAIASEIKRQTDLMKRGEAIVRETRFFDPKTDMTKPLRMKEDATDYRYVPEPSIPPIRLDEQLVSNIRAQLPSRIPADIRKLLIEDCKLDLAIAVEVMDEPGLSDYFMQVMRDRVQFDPDVIADFLIYTINNLKSVVGPNVPIDMDQNGRFQKILPPRRMQPILDMMTNDEISYTTAYELIKYMIINEDTNEPREIVEHFDWYQINDMDKINEYCEQIIQNMKSVPKKYAKRRSLQDLRMLIDKVCHLTGYRISVRKAIDRFNELLLPPKQ